MIQTLEGFNRSKVVNFKQIYSDPLIKMKKYSEAYTRVGPALNANGYPVTGLTEDFKEPAKVGKIPAVIPGTRRALEKELDLPEGTLKPTSSYWDTFHVAVGSDVIELNLEDPQDLLKYLFLTAQTIVANGLSAIDSDSRIEFVLYSEEQEAETRVNSRKTLKEAYNMSEKLDLEAKINILAVYGVIVDSSSPNTIEDKIDEQIEKDPVKFISIVKDDYLVFKSLVTKCLDKGILIAADGGIYHNEVLVGYDKDSAAESLAKDATLTAMMKARLSGDMDLISSALKAQAQAQSAESK